MNDSVMIWLAWHESETDGCREFKLIGVFSTRERARAAIDARRGKPGFADTPDGFDMAVYELDRDTAWRDGFITVH